MGVEGGTWGVGCEGWGWGVRSGVGVGDEGGVACQRSGYRVWKVEMGVGGGG